MKNGRIIAAIFTAVFTIIFVLSTAASAAEESSVEQKRVLYLSSYSYSWGSVPFQIEGLSESLGSGYVVNYEFMDTKNTVYSADYKEFYDLLKYKLSTREPYDGVVVCDDAALIFTQKYKDELFAGIPIVFSGIDNVKNGIDAAKNPNETGVVEIVDYAANMRLAGSLFPNAKKLVLILDNMENGIGIAEQLNASSDVFDGYEVEYINSSQYTNSQLIARLKALNESEIVFCISMGQDKNGTVYSEDERFEMIRDYVTVPLFRFTQSGIGKGLLGGSIVDHKESCRIAGDMLKQLLDGEKAADVCLDTPKYYCFDYNIMKKYGIKLSQLPPDVRNSCVIVNSPEVFLQAHATAIVSILGGTIIVILLIGAFVRIKSIKKLADKNTELAKAVLEANTANQAKSQFLSRMSHDMRTPMNAILGITGLLKDRTDPVEIQDDITQIESSGKYLLSLINDSLDMDKIEAGKLELHPKPINSEMLFKNVITTAQILSAQKGVNLKIEFPQISHGQWVAVEADASRVEQIFMNIITNAVKFTPSGGSVTMHMETIAITEEAVTDKYIISDTGCGMSREFMEHLFEPFSQENRIVTNRENGTGLGLTIVKRIIDLMDGTIRVESVPDKGTAFTIILSYPRYNGTVENTDEKQYDLSILNGKRVLLCEDHPINAQIATRLLNKKGIIVEHAENGQIGVEMLSSSAENYYDAVLMDIQMPIMNGLEATKAIRGIRGSYAETVPIIAMTANAYDSDIQHSLNAGMNAHLGKPIEPERLYRVLAEQISLHKVT